MISSQFVRTEEHYVLSGHWWTYFHLWNSLYGSHCGSVWSSSESRIFPIAANHIERRGWVMLTLVGFQHKIEARQLNLQKIDRPRWYNLPYRSNLARMWETAEKHSDEHGCIAVLNNTALGTRILPGHHQEFDIRNKFIKNNSFRITENIVLLLFKIKLKSSNWFHEINGL